MTALGPRRLVVFDLDGTLVDSSRDLATAVNAMLRDLAPSAAALPLEVVRSLVGHGARNLVVKSLERVRIVHPADDALARFLAHYDAHLLDTTRLYPGVAEGLAALDGRTLAVLTNKPGGMSRRILESLGVAQRFGRILGGGDGAAAKPDPGGLTSLMTQFGAKANQTLMVGDSSVDVQTARAAGAAAAGVSWGLDPESLRAFPPDVMVESLSALAQLC